MQILVFNAGSSSLKFRLYHVEEERPKVLLHGAVRSIGDEARYEWSQGAERWNGPVEAADHAAAAHQVFALLQARRDSGQLPPEGVAAVGHRIVHGGDLFSGPTRLTDEILARLDALSALAPLHNPPALAVIAAARAELGALPMVGVFDTAFFHALPEHVYSYALPGEWRAPPHHIRRYGFHGLAHRYMAERVDQLHGGAERIVSLQLGHGCSVAAVRDGQAIEVSMGFTPLEGLIMATRAGDVDPGALLQLLNGGVTVPELEEGLNRRAGLLGLSGVSSDMQELLRLEAEGDAAAKLAIEAFCHRARKYLGAYLAILGGADALVFGGGIGEGASVIRERICADMGWCGIELDERGNRTTQGRAGAIASAASRIAVYVLPVDEESLIVRDTLTLLQG